MKKILSCVLCLAMMLSMGTVAFASEISTDGGSQNTVVTYGMSEGFTVTIPTNFTIDETKKATADVSASNVVIAHGSTLKVAVSGNDYVDSWELVDEAEATNTLTYTIGTTEGGNDIVNNSVVLSVGAGEAYGSTVTETMHFTVIDELSKAGTYKDTLTFTVSVEDAVELISFNVGGTTFQAEKDMTWGEWIESEYNVWDWKINDVGNIEISRDEYTYSIVEDVTEIGALDYPTSTYKIIPNHQYSTYGASVY